MFYVYVLHSVRDSLYIGYSPDLRGGVAHERGQVRVHLGHIFFKPREAEPRPPGEAFYAVTRLNKVTGCQ